MIDTQVATPPQFDATQYIKQRNEAEQAARSGKPVPKVEEPAAPKTAEPPAKPAEDDHASQVPRSIRRELNRMREELGYERGRSETLEALLAKSRGTEEKPIETAKDEKPARSAYASDAEFVAALAGWTTREELRKHDSERSQDDTLKAQNETLRQQIVSASQKFEADRETLKETYESAIQDGMSDEQPEIDWLKHPGLSILLATSDVRAGLLIYLAKHPKDVQKLLDLTPNPADQVQLFRRLEGKAESIYDSAKKPEPVAPKPTAAERDAKKPKPSEAVSPQGGTSITSDGPEPTILVNGRRVINPAWKAARNMASGARP
jgi:hypothetical protein